jgi:3-methyl-2-oxobutanoate hydroxymethyltransferase
MKKETVQTILQSKGKRKLTMITAYDALFAKLLEPHCDMILVGDSLNMSFAGKEDTLSATLDQMIYHTNAVCAGAPNSFVVFDMPYGSYNNKKSALANAVKVYQTTNANAVKIEGGKSKASIVKHLTDNGIAVFGHIGLLPQMVRGEGGYSVKGKDEKQMQQIIEDAKVIESAGAFALVIEGVKSDVAAQVAQSVTIPVIGIGAGKEVDGQVLVWSDMLGFFEAFKPKFVKRYLDGATLVKQAVEQYDQEVKEGVFPSSEYSY